MSTPHNSRFFSNDINKMYFKKVLASVVGFLSIFVLFGWITKNSNLVSLLAISDSTMKANTSLAFIYLQ
ncbi:MAG: hypothetical protein HWD82_00330 [Flavobacteriaceae bacterium]|nr:hypothetical protein [Flavobacteriaceae bacterium]